jgi:hypothetical protein
MKSLRVIDEVGNGRKCETELVPRIGERIELEYGDPVTTHYFRVKDVVYGLGERTSEVAVLIAEEENPKHWPRFRAAN